MVSVSSVFSVKISPVGKAPHVAKGLPVTIDVQGSFGDATVGDIKRAIVDKFPEFYPDRQKLALVGEKKALDDDVKLNDIGLSENNVELTAKDLGPQISWKTVFLIEYAGPLVIHPIIFNAPKLFYGNDFQHSELQNYLYAFVLLHFVKRELETLFVHRFSHATMPLFNVFKNSAHYHILSGLFLAYGLYGPGLSAAAVRGTYKDDPRLLLIGTIVWAWAEFSNLATHITLRNLRPAGTKKRAIPTGYGFDLVSCPNYFFEAVAWTAVSILSGSLVAWLFTAASCGQMGIWAIKKHKAYKKEFGAQYPKRKIMVPFIW